MDADCVRGQEEEEGLGSSVFRKQKSDGERCIRFIVRRCRVGFFGMRYVSNVLWYCTPRVGVCGTAIGRRFI